MKTDKLEIQLNAAIIKLEHDKLAVVKVVDEYENIIKNQTGEINKLQNELDLILKSNIIKLEQKKVSNKALVAKLTNKYEKIVKEQVVEIGILQTKLDSIMHSRSWKITKPLRALATLIKRRID